MKIKAAVLNAMGTATPYAESKPLRIEEVELAPPGPGEVLIKVAAAGLCHSDLSVINGDRPRPMPMALGHEASGIVEELGAGVTDLKVGDHVVVVFVPSCGHCAPCAEGRPALCEPGAAANGAGTLLSGERRLSHGGEPLNHHLGCSVFAEYATVSRRSVVKIDPAVPLGDAALFGCAVLTGVGAVVNTAQVRVGASVAVIGLGGVGLAALIGAHAAGARQIIAIDLADDKLEQARALGATHTVNAGQDNALEQIRSLSSGGVEFAFEFAGSIRALDLAYRITRRGGMTVTAGLPPSTANWPLPAVSLVAEERTLKGSYIGTCVPSRDIPHYVDLYSQGRLPVNKLLTGRLKLDEINHGFDLLHEGKAIRQVVVFD
ncbi:MULTISPECIES: zinc-dependent alcohol dehydrogenase family protein [unclassified Caballeronia]|uniref:zinc-dependent alcohol dehydrogenase family protein n=1 Tax=unclassified Caballeronia TaxID=2646786 RepID=UPI001FCFEF7C|nr:MULTISPECIES: zinc-dependent alcohol dehydrogenase family protein [unclassified Caballeronia]MDR5774511.1 zinc-dependent alcohol dehydrogenase family protein [Caballeronia sp. LZ002]MDR5799882.1 zinc-dependent alcohol dehydrogenase family protein [Caballeronia sp. LZ001]MDR5849947.1 zinc-dependent alcohol dehydrogenase family protein [Caballeronia sp. LZ003]